MINPHQFVDHLEQRVVNHAANSLYQAVASPVWVRQPNPTIAKLSEWYSGLPDEGRNMLRLAISRAAATTILEFLAILDGASEWNPETCNGRLDLYYNYNGVSLLLNRPEGPSLHEQLSIP